VPIKEGPFRKITPIFWRMIASMDHWNASCNLDGGTTSVEVVVELPGRPFLSPFNGCGFPRLLFNVEIKASFGCLKLDNIITCDGEAFPLSTRF
jgi:hypothetical protein